MKKRRRWLWIGLAVFITATVLLAPLWLGYFGPDVAAWAQTWRPWRTHVTVTNVHVDSSERASVVVEYSDPWPDPGRSPGQQIDFQTVKRSGPLLPWRVTGHGTGP